jgi:hypothetical protein
MDTFFGTGGIYKGGDLISSVVYRLYFSKEEQLGRSDMSGIIECQKFPPLNEGEYLLKLSDGAEMRIQIMAGNPIGNNPHNGFSYNIRLSGAE